MSNLFTILLFALLVATSFGRQLKVTHHRQEHSPVIYSHAGRVRGILVDASLPRPTYEFLAIPYAEAPIGHRRFEMPEPKHRFSRVFQADRKQKICPMPMFPEREDIDEDDRWFEGRQGQLETSEDCLRLSIWVPKETILRRNHHHKKLSVLAFFHAGGYNGGGITGYDGSYMASFNKIIVVAIQYRVGLLGFAYNDYMTANLGLWDQLLALHWIHRNIGAFGGSRHDVTIGGQGQSANLVSLHLLSHRGRRFYHRAIIQSSTANSPMGILTREDARQLTERLFKRIISKYCPGNLNDNSDIFQHCLKYIDPSIFVKQLEKTGSTSVHLLPLMLPVIDGHFVRHDPRELLRHGHFHKVPLLIGVTKDEGKQYVCEVKAVKDGTKDGAIKFSGWKDYTRLLHSLANFYGEMFPIVNESIVIDSVKYQYWPKTRDNWFATDSRISEALSTAVGDAGITCPTFRWAKKAAWHVSRVFMYYFTHRRAKSSNANSDKWRAVSQGSELGFVFGEALSAKSTWYEYKDSDRSFSQMVLTYWGNFVKYGTPNGRHARDRTIHNLAGSRNRNTTVMLPFWPPHLNDKSDNCRYRYFELSPKTVAANVTNNGVICRLNENNCLLWDKHLPRLTEYLFVPRRPPFPIKYRPRPYPYYGDVLDNDS